MNIFLVGDNRTYNNWGGRAMSIALYELVSEVGTINSAMSLSKLSSHTADISFVGPFLPPKLSHLYDRAVENSKQHTLYRVIATVLKLTGARDLVQQEPEVTARMVLKYRKKYESLDDICNRIESNDVVIINGEGQLIFSVPTRREPLFLLALIALANHFGKPVYYTNAIVSDCPATGRNEASFRAASRMFALCEKVLVRDQESLAIVRDEMQQNINSELVPDSLFIWSSLFVDGRTLPPDNGNLIVPYPERQRYINKLDFSVPYICIGGSAAADDHNRAIEVYVALVEQFKTLGYKIYLTENDGRDSFLEEVAKITGVGIIPVWTPIYSATAILANARLSVLGRYHPSIMAALGGCPCVFIASVGHKLKSIQELLGYDESVVFPVYMTGDDAKAMVRRGKHLLEAGDILRKRIEQKAAELSRQAYTFCNHIKES